MSAATSTAKTVSPGAALLRTSRLFSLPKPLPPAPGDITGASRQQSDTATLPFPIHQTIASPPVSRARGDWGFKRPLPAKTTSRASEPLVRIKHVDAVERVTDFHSATDHTMTLRKWQALHVPLTLQTDAEQRQQLAGKSVFEEQADVVALPADQRHTAADTRWKFKGPWLAGITDGAFQAYLRKQVRPRRSAFRTDANLTAYLRALRHDRPLLYRLVGKFLDLAPVAPSEKIYQNLARSSSSLTGGFLSPLLQYGADSGLLGGGGGGGNTSASGPGNPWAQDGPPSTHPSAGLSYLRTAAYIDNHPLYGPQKAHPPVPARVVAPRNASGSWPAKLGVAGFVADTPVGETAYHTRHTRSLPGLSLIDPTIVGGAKLPVRVAAAKINSQGRVIVAVAEADPEAVLVQRELEGKERLYGQTAQLAATRADSQPLRRTTRFGIGPAGPQGGGSSSNPIISSPRNYGLGQ
ncbi:hypothetical protein SPI_07404 [Niveomyces insectorum RCEF 264]|uniref:Mitochondrial ribosomal protein subunit n=1 Tax=Niveomyces insectorum RCEF 264 TaxID=1081102 RepID=A0A167PTY4_9HYPO|nr:hypothetical protein SPI_07404 [Niveomyces insectorum RCEF 264]